MISLVLLCIFTTIGVANEQAKFERMPATSGDLAGGWQRSQCADLVLAGGSCTAVGGARLAVGASRGLCPAECLRAPEYNAALRGYVGVVRKLWRTWQQDECGSCTSTSDVVASPDLRAQRPAQQPRESAVDGSVPTASVPTPTATIEPTATPRADAPTAVTASAQPSQTVTPVSDIAAAICSKPWPCAEALAVVYGPTPPNRDAPYGCAHGESGGDPTVSNGTSYGLFQVNFAAHEDAVASPAALLDPATNIEVAYEIWRDQGWAPWSCRP